MSNPPIRRDDLAQLKGMTPRLMRAFEHQAATVEQASSTLPDTQAMKDATVIVLSANGDFTNERILQVGEGISVEITDNTVTLSVDNVARTQDHGATFVAPADVLLFLPADGTLLSDTSPLTKYPGFGNYATDAAAAAGGVPINFPYHNAGAMRVRLT